MTIRISAFEAHAASNGEQEAVSRQGGGSGGGGKSQGLVERRPDEDARQILNVLESWEAVQRRVGGVLKYTYIHTHTRTSTQTCTHSNNGADTGTGETTAGGAPGAAPGGTNTSQQPSGGINGSDRRCTGCSTSTSQSPMLFCWQSGWPTCGCWSAADLDWSRERTPLKSGHTRVTKPPTSLDAAGEAAAAAAAATPAKPVPPS